MGQIYVRVDAGVSGKSANALNTSNPGGAVGGGSDYWLYWNTNGFIGAGWFWGEDFSYLPTGWDNAVNFNNTGCDNPHTTDRSSFQAHVNEGVNNLDTILGDWPGTQKSAFVNEYRDELNYDPNLGVNQAADSCVRPY